MMNNFHMPLKQRVVFISRALLFHAAFLSSYLMYNQRAEFVMGWSSWIYEGTYSILFLLGIFTFYFRPDIFFLSPTLRHHIQSRLDPRQPLPVFAFYITKLCVWIAVLGLPTLFLVFASLIPNYVQAYMLFAFLFFFGFNGGFLFAGYKKYLTQKSEHKWGVLAIYSK